MISQLSFVLKTQKEYFVATPLKAKASPVTNILSLARTIAGQLMA
jgi:hypothetical protein